MGGEVLIGKVGLPCTGGFFCSPPVLARRFSRRSGTGLSFAKGLRRRFRRTVAFSSTAALPVHNLAYRLALLAGVGGLVLLTIAGSGDDIRTPLGVALIAGGGLLVGLGKAVDVLGYVQEGATDTEEHP